MLNYNKDKKVLTINQTVTINDLLTFGDGIWLRDIIYFDKILNRIIIATDIVIEETATLILNNSRIKLLGNYISVKHNASFIIGSDSPFESTDIDFNNCDLYCYPNVNLNIKNSKITSKKNWELSIEQLLSVVNTSINFKIINNSKTNMIMKNITLENNGNIISMSEDVVFHNLKSNYTRDILCTPRNENNSIVLYDSDISNFNYIATNRYLTKTDMVNIFIKSKTIENISYTIEKINTIDNITIVHEVLLRGKFLAVKNGVIDYNHNGIYDITDKDNILLGKLVVINGIVEQYIPYYFNNKITFPLSIGNGLFTIDTNTDFNNFIYVSLDNITKTTDNILIERMIRDMSIEQNNNYKDVINLLHHIVETSGKPIKVTPPLIINSPGGTKITM
jgi:hypothetical protein